MRRANALLMIAAACFALFGAVFGRASWIGINNHSIATWQFLELIAFVLFTSSLAIEIPTKRG